MDVSAFDCFEFFSGVPDSLLKPFYDYLINRFGVSGRHIIAANEGNAVALAAGYYLSTGKLPVVYLQNSGIGNIINPAVSLCNEKVYGIPILYVIGWRGEPGIHDEPQHIFQGEVTLKMLENTGIETFVVEKQTSITEFSGKITEWRQRFSLGKSAAFVVKKGALTFDGKLSYKNNNVIIREEAISKIVDAAGEGLIISTTGKASRELFEIREQNEQDHRQDFLTVGSMGHSSSIALALALHKPNKKIWVIDGDGAVLMHMGAMAVIGSNRPGNLIHIVINNSSHESVGGAPTVAGSIDLIKIAEACGYQMTYSVADIESLEAALREVSDINKLCFIEIKAAVSSRDNLSRPTTTAYQNKICFMENLCKQNLL